MGWFSKLFPKKDQEPDGPFETYHENGQLWMRGTSKDGKLVGPFEVYHENGQLKSKGTFHDGGMEIRSVPYTE